MMMTEEDLLTPSFLRELQGGRQELRRIRLYFDQNDEMVDEDIALHDLNNYYHKYHTVEIDMIKAQCAGLDGDCEDDDSFDIIQELQTMKGGKSKNSTARKVEKITKDTFYGEKSTDNAEIFINTLQKTRTKHLKKVQDRELFLAGGTLNNESPEEEVEQPLFTEGMLDDKIILKEQQQ